MMQLLEVFFARFCAAVLLAALALPAFAGERFYYSYAHDVHLPPYLWYDASEGGGDGYTPLLLQAMSRELGVELRGRSMPLKSFGAPNHALARVLSGDDDFYFMPRQYIPDDDLLYVLPTPIYQVRSQVFVRNDSAVDMADWSQLKGLRGGRFSAMGVSGLPRFDAYAAAELTLKSYTGYREVAEALVGGELDYAIGMSRSLLLALRLTGDGYHFRPAGEPIVSVPVHMFISTQSALYQRRGELEAQLEFYRGAGRMQLLMEDAMKQYLLCIINQAGVDG